MTLKGRTGYALAWVAVGAGLWLYVERREVVARFRAYQENDVKVGEAAAKAAALEEEYQDTQVRVKNLHSNPLEMETAIRRAKGLVRPGEIVYRIMDDNTVTTVPEAAPAAALEVITPPEENNEATPKESALEAINPEMD